MILTCTPTCSIHLPRDTTARWMLLVLGLKRHAHPYKFVINTSRYITDIICASAHLNILKLALDHTALADTYTYSYPAYDRRDIVFLGDSENTLLVSVAGDAHLLYTCQIGSKSKPNAGPRQLILSIYASLRLPLLLPLASPQSPSPLSSPPSPLDPHSYSHSHVHPHSRPKTGQYPPTVHRCVDTCGTTRRH